MRHKLRHLSTAIIASSAFLMMTAAPSTFVPFGSETAFAKEKGSGKSGNKSEGKSGSKKGSSGSGKNGKSSSAPGGVAKASAGKPKAIVRQYVIENGLKQGDVAKLLKSWNSLNRNEQAYLNNKDNPNSLSGLQIAYIRDNIEAEAALAEWEAIKDNLVEPPTEDQSIEAQALIEQFNAWTAYKEADPADLEGQGVLLADFEALGGDQSNPPSEDQLIVAQTLADQYDSWTAYQDAETAAYDSFVSASVSYSGDVYDDATFVELRDTVDAIVDLKELDTLVSFDLLDSETEVIEIMSISPRVD